MINLNEFSAVWNETQLNESNGAAYHHLVELFMKEVNPALQPYLQVYASDNITSAMTVKLVGLGADAKGVDHFNSRIAVFNMIPSSKNAFKFLGGGMKDWLGIKPPQARASKTPEEATIKLAKWFNKHWKTIIEYIHTSWTK